MEMMHMASSTVETLQEFIEVVERLGGEAEPERLLQAARLENDVDKFFDLIREGRNSGVLEVPVGIGGLIRRKRNAN